VLDWDLVRYFLAVARCGSTLTASRELRQSQPTVARRIAALEAAIGHTLFERRQAGYRLSEDGAALMETAEALERAAGAFCDAAAARSRQLSGTVKLTCGEMLANYHLAPMLTEFRASYPDIRVELVVTEAVLDIASGEADVAVRGVEPGGEWARAQGSSRASCWRSPGSPTPAKRTSQPAALRDPPRRWSATT